MTDIPELTELQQQALDRAREIMQHEPWFQGVCLTELTQYSDVDIQRDGIEEVAQALVFETAMWDDPDFFDDGLMGA